MLNNLKKCPSVYTHLVNTWLVTTAIARAVAARPAFTPAPFAATNIVARPSRVLC